MQIATFLQFNAWKEIYNTTELGCEVFFFNMNTFHSLQTEGYKLDLTFVYAELKKCKQLNFCGT